uniref:Uncharacterized protein n=1 Tax=viral metagenome TaxID=1070528 RepID=A0A6C0ESC4_9ZZZZ
MFNRVKFTIKSFLQNPRKRYDFAKNKKIYNEFKNKNIIKFNNPYSKTIIRKNHTYNHYNNNSNGNQPPKPNIPKYIFMSILLGSAYFMHYKK